MMEELNQQLVFVVAILVVVIVPLVIYLRKTILTSRRKTVVAILKGILFPDGENQVEETIESLRELTSSRFTDEQLMDYYLKIKGLQLLDLNTMKDESVCRFLMEPTEIRLKYDELVMFYEKYINYPQVRGLNAVGGI